MDLYMHFMHTFIDTFTCNLQSWNPIDNGQALLFINSFISLNDKKMTYGSCSKKFRLVFCHSHFHFLSICIFMTRQIVIISILKHSCDEIIKNSFRVEQMAFFCFRQKNEHIEKKSAYSYDCVIENCYHITKMSTIRKVDLIIYLRTVTIHITSWQQYTKKNRHLVLWCSER